jgi:hypothetical protein
VAKMIELGSCTHHIYDSRHEFGPDKAGELRLLISGNRIRYFEFLLDVVSKM